MNRALSSSAYHALWWPCVPLLPVVAWQGRRLRKRVPRLPEGEGPRAGQVYPGEPPGLSIAVLGESSAAAVGVTAQTQGVAHQLAVALAAGCGQGVRWQAVGRTGATVAKVHRLLMNRLVLPVDVAVIAVGVNDTLRLTPGKQWRATLRALASDLLGRGVGRVVFSSVPQVGDFPALPEPTRSVLGVRAKLLDAIMRELAPTLPATTHAPVRFTSLDCAASDGFHPSERGYGEWAAQLALHLQPLLTAPARVAANHPQN